MTVPMPRVMTRKRQTRFEIDVRLFCRINPL